MKWAYVVISWASDVLRLHVELFTEEEAGAVPVDDENGLPSVVKVGDAEALPIDDGPCTWDVLCSGDTDVCLRLLEVIRNEATPKQFDAIPDYATVEIVEVRA